MRCCVCEKDHILLLYSLYDDRYGYPGCFNLMHCTSCGHLFLDEKFSPDQLADLYSNYYPRSSFDIETYKFHKETSGFFSWFDGANSSVFRWVPRNVRVLDIGCGFGESLGYHTARGCDVYGVEADENIRRVAEKFGYNVHVGLFDPDVYESDFFDYVTMDQVLEHVVAPLEVLRGVERVLKPGGQVILSVPNAAGWGAKVFGSKWINWHAPYHLQFYSEHSIQVAARKAGLEMIEEKTITPSAWLYFQWLHLLTYPKQGEPSAFWAGAACGDPTALSIGKKAASLVLAVLHKIKLNHLITRFFDRLGMGDSRVFILRKPEDH